MKCKLGDIVDITMGQSPKSEYYNTEKKGYPFLQGNRTFGFKYPTFDIYTKVLTKSAKAGDIIMSVRAPVGDLNITPVDVCIGRGVCSLRMKNGNQSFLFYMMKYYVPHLQKKENGTVFGSVNRNDINELEVNIPEDEQIQRKIAEYLEVIDDKIQLNNMINNNLFEQIRVISTAWLSDYIPFGGILPENWYEISLAEIAEFISGYSYKGKELSTSTIAMATIKNFDRKGGFKLDGYKEIKPSSKLKDNQVADLFDTLVAHTDLTQNAEVIGNAELVMSKSIYTKIVFSMDLVKVIPRNKKISKLFEKNKYMYEIYPTIESRQALTVFQIYEGNGEWFDLSKKPIERANFTFGNAFQERSGYFITNSCIGCNKCVEVCPQNCIISDSIPYVIEQNHCLHCGNCFRVCPIEAVERR